MPAAIAVVGQAEQARRGDRAEHVLEVEAADELRVRPSTVAGADLGVVGQAVGEERRPRSRSSSASRRPHGLPTLTAAGGAASPRNSRRFASK